MTRVVDQALAPCRKHQAVGCADELLTISKCQMALPANFTDKTSLYGSDRNMPRWRGWTLRPSRINSTFDDATAFTKPWKGELTMGGRALPGGLKGARADEAAAK